MASQGEITEANVQHPTIGSYTFFTMSSSDGTYDEGGIRSNDDDSAIASNGEAVYTMNRTRGGFETTIHNDQNIRNDAATLKLLAASPVSGTWTFSVINGTVYRGTGKPVGDLKPSIQTGTMALKVTGGEFVKFIG